MRKIINRIGRYLVSKYIYRLKKVSYHKLGYIDAIYAKYKSPQGGATLDIGSGPRPRNPFGAEKIYGIDIREYLDNQVYYCDLALGKLPFNDDEFDFVTAYDVIEHIQRLSIDVNNINRFPFIELMNEIFRVLKPGGIFFNTQPCFPFKEAFQDPTHVNIMSEDTMELYFCEPAWARIYGYSGSFAMMEDGWVGSSYFSFMRKSCDKPVKDLGFVQK